MANERLVKVRWPLLSFDRISDSMSLSIQKLTTLLDLTPRRSTISANRGIRRFSRKKAAMDFLTVWIVRFSFMVTAYRTFVLLSRSFFIDTCAGDVKLYCIRILRRTVMKNVEMKVEGNILTIKVDLTKDFGPSSSGKTIIIASPEGNVVVDGHEEAKVGLNVYRKK